MSQATRELLESFFTKKRFFPLDRFDQFDWNSYERVQALIDAARAFKRLCDECFGQADLNELRDFLFEQLAFFYSIGVSFNAEVAVLNEALGFGPGEADQTPSGPGQAEESGRYLPDRQLRSGIKKPPEGGLLIGLD